MGLQHFTLTKQFESFSRCQRTATEKLRFFLFLHDLGAFDAEKLRLHFRRIRFTPKFTPIKSFTP